ncbi:MAG TPA: flagellar assembly protein FliX [Ferrovibrio sp.]|uniref:flagellar assembly protein FliX n=1 Tax=Ferrovibrio sp. TaxID=1917215 RepID=UPI002ED2EA43
MSVNKISGPGGVKPGAAKRASSGAADGPSFANLLKETDKAPSQVTQAAPATALETVLAVQAADEWSGNRKNRQRAFQRGSSLLDQLDEIRHGLLEGRIPAERLQVLARQLRQEKLAVEDPAQAEILAEIELRCEVELAKLGL